MGRIRVRVPKGEVFAKLGEIRMKDDNDEVNLCVDASGPSGEMGCRGMEIWES